MAFQPSNPPSGGNNPGAPKKPGFIVPVGGTPNTGAPSGPRPFSERPAFQGRRDRFQSFTKDEHRINERIRVPQVRLIDENGGQVGVVPTAQALQMARDRGLDLMEVAANANPPVCKICDYGKFKYEKKKKDHAAKKKQVVIKVKEVQLRPQTEEHDLEYKFKNVKEFLNDGDKAKVMVTFRGREIAYVEQGHKMLNRLVSEVKDIAIVEYGPKLEGKKLMLILAPSGGAKKVGSGSGSEA